MTGAGCAATRAASSVDCEISFAAQASVSPVQQDQAFLLGQPAPRHPVLLLDLQGVLAAGVDHRAVGAHLLGASDPFVPGRATLALGWKKNELAMPRQAASACQSQASVVGTGSRPIKATLGPPRCAGERSHSDTRPD